MNIFLLGIILVSLIFILYLRYLILFLIVPKKIKLAIKLLESHREGQAVKHLTDVLKIDRGNSIANWLMCRIYIKKDQYILAQMYLYDILYNFKFTEEINEVKVRETLAFLYQKLGDFNKALVQYYLLKKENKLTLSGLKNSIRITIKKKNYNQAVLLLKFAKSVNKDDGELDFFSAQVDFNNNILPSAERKLKFAIKKGYHNYEVDLLLGKIYFFSGKYNLALVYFYRISSNYLNNAELESFIGQCSYYLKDYDTTIKILEDFLKDMNKKKNKFAVNMEYILGSAYESVGNIKKALKLWNEIDSYASYFQPVKEKLRFYNNIAKDSEVMNILSMKASVFIEKGHQIIASLDYTIEKKLFEDKRTLEYLCSSNKSNSFFNLFYFYITRKTEAVGVELLNNIFINAKQKKTRSIIVISSHYKDDALIFAKRNCITVYTFEIFR